jgi:SAM-dependent methyltransferase
MPKKEFSHKSYFTVSMKVVFQITEAEKRAQKILDIPAGGGLLGTQLSKLGHIVVNADINRERPDFIFADMNEKLPFSDGEFDIVSCMEGIEHTLEPINLIKELCRITRSGGKIILTTPNIQNIFSRLKFLCMGYFFLFSPWSGRQLQPGQKKDSGHISPLTYLQLRYFFQHGGAKVVDVKCQRWKKKWLIPFMFPFLATGWVWSRIEMPRGEKAKAEYREMLDHLFSPATLFGRSLILVFKKN